MRTTPLSLPAAAGAALPLSAAAPAIHLRPPERTEARTLIARLRDHIARHDEQAFKMERKDVGRRDREPRTHAAWTLGASAVDSHLPAAGLVRAGLHDISPARYGDFPAACGFALALAIRRLEDGGERRPLLWCRLETEVREYGRSYGYGIEQLGLHRQRFLTLTLRKPVALFWTLEEALKSGALAVVLGDVAVQHLTLTASRRLALAGQQGRAAGLIVLTRNYSNATASQSRWCIATSASPSAGLDPRAPGPPTWQVGLTRIRGGRPGDWTVSWQKDHASHRFTLVSGFSGGALHPGATETAGPNPARKPALRTG
jgi:protein ImuA